MPVSRQWGWSVCHASLSMCPSGSEAMRAVKRDMRRLHVTLSGGMPEMMSRLPMGDVLKVPVIHRVA